MTVQVRCPACGEANQFSSRPLTHNVPCAKCGKVFRLAPRSPTSSSTTSHASGMITAGPETLDAATESALPDAAPLREPAPPASPHVPSASQCIARFSLRARLGSGAFGTVYRAHDPQLDREVALKVPHQQALDNPIVLKRFLREARAVARLQHPHIVPVYDAGLAADRHYIASAFIDGQTLAKLIRGSRPDFQHSTRIVQQLAEALHYAHGLNIVHRDVKPANVMIDPSGDAHLMDFGLAYLQEEAEKLTQDGAVLGTPAYMPPEHARGQHGDAHPASDQYSLGVILYELLCGQPPFTGPAQAVLYAVLNTTPPRPLQLNPRVPRDLETVCLKAMAKDPAQRYPDCGQLADDLRRWLKGEPIQVRRPSIVQRAVRWCRREPVLATAGVVALTTLVAVIFTASVSAARFADLAQKEHAHRLQAAEGLAKATEARKQAELTALREKEARREAEEQKQKAAKALEDEQKAKEEAETASREAAKEASQAEAERKVLQEEEKKAAEARAAEEQSRKERQKAEQLRLTRPHQEIELKRPSQSNLAFTSDERHVVVGLETHVTVWDVASGRQVEYNGHPNSVVALTVSPDGPTIVSVSKDGKCKFWRLAKDKLLLQPPPIDDVTALSYSPDGGLVALVCAGKVRLFDGRKFTLLSELPAAEQKVTRVSLGPEGKRLALVTTDGRARVWDAAGRELHVLPAKEGRIADVVFSPAGDRYATVGNGVSVWGADKGELLFALPEQQHPAFSPDGRYLATAKGPELTLWNAKTGEKLKVLTGDRNITSVAFSPKGKRLATVENADTVKIWVTPLP